MTHILWLALRDCEGPLNAAAEDGTIAKLFAKHLNRK